MQLQEFDTYSECVDALLGGQVDAVTTDDIILAGYAAQYPGKLKVVGKPFTTEKYGIGLKKDDKAGRDAVNAAIEKVFADGTWKAAFEKTARPVAATRCRRRRRRLEQVLTAWSRRGAPVRRAASDPCPSR